MELAEINWGAELKYAIGQKELDAVIDCAGAPEDIQMGLGMLATSGHYCAVRLVGDTVQLPLFPLVCCEYMYQSSYWGKLQIEFRAP